MDQRIEESRLEITRVKEDLVKAKIVRKNRMEYDPIVARIKELPTRAESLEKIDKMKSLADRLREKIDELDGRLEQRRQQFQALVTQVHELNHMLNEDEALALEYKKYQRSKEQQENRTQTASPLASPALLLTIRHHDCSSSVVVAKEAVVAARRSPVGSRDNEDPATV